VAHVNGKVVHIRDFVKDESVTPRCANGHVLHAAQGRQNEWHFRHSNPSDISSSLSAWHVEWQSHFAQTEKCFEMVDGQHSRRRADVVEGKYVVEIQHSFIPPDEVDRRNHDYALHHKQVIWIVDGSSMVVTGDVLTVDADWKVASFLNCDFVFINVNEVVYAVHPAHVRSCTVHVSPVAKSALVDAIKRQSVHGDVPTQNKITLKQQGAGNGKTWGIVDMLARDAFAHYRTFIYVTKQHSNKFILNGELRKQLATLGFTDIGEIREVEKKFVCNYTNQVGGACVVIIATVDSFLYALGDSSVVAYEKFPAIAASIVEGHLDVVDRRGTIEYAGIDPTLNATTLYIIDEVQDLPKVYADAVLTVARKTNMDVYAVGDQLQSLAYELNALETLRPLATCEPPTNVCRRFTHPQLVSFVNHMTPFEHYGLPAIVPYTATDDDATHPAVFPRLAKMGEDGRRMDIEDTVRRILLDMRTEVYKHWYTPEAFLVVLLFVSNNPLANMLDSAVCEMWVEIFQDPEYRRHLTDPYWKAHVESVQSVHSVESVDSVESATHHRYYRYCVLHKCENGTSINLAESERSTRMVSIPSSKGDGRSVVFVVGVTESGLRHCCGYKHSLRYDSMLHVALTRAKRSLYVVYIEDDEIGRRVKAWLDQNGHECDVSKIDISSTVKMVDLIPVCGEDFNALVKLDYVDDSDVTQLVDAAHHNIRSAILTEKVRELLEDENSSDGKRQIKTHKWVACNTPIKICKSWKAYNERVCSNYNYIRSKDPNKRTIPLLQINDATHSRYIRLIVLHMNHIQQTCSKRQLCPFELIVFHYMSQIIQRSYMSNITMMELYNIVDVYYTSFKHHFQGHALCKCRETFADNDNRNSLSDYLTTHYAQMGRVKDLVAKLLVAHPNTSWNVDHCIVYTGADSRFKLTSTVGFIGYNDSDVVLAYLTPNLTPLNVYSLKTQAMCDAFVVKHDGDAQNCVKYHGKNVAVRILAVNLDEPLALDVVVDDAPIKAVMERSMCAFFSPKNRDVVHFYRTLRRQHPDPRKFGEAFIKNWLRHTTKRTPGKDEENRQLHIPLYLEELMAELRAKSRGVDISAFVADLDVSFASRLQRSLECSVADFLELASDWYEG
jgi:hypothetical protein